MRSKKWLGFFKWLGRHHATSPWWNRQLGFHKCRHSLRYSAGKWALPKWDPNGWGGNIALDVGHACHVVAQWRQMWIKRGFQKHFLHCSSLKSHKRGRQSSTWKIIMLLGSDIHGSHLHFDAVRHRKHVPYQNISNLMQDTLNFLHFVKEMYLPLIFLIFCRFAISHCFLQHSSVGG